MQNRKIVILTSHVFLEGYRKASIHFVAQNWAMQGHEVHFTTVGHSRLSAFKQPARYKDLKGEQDNRYVELAPGLHAGAYLPLFHAFSTGNPAINGLIGPLFKLYGARLPQFVTARIREADLVVIESGTPISFFPLVKRLNPHARTLYFCRDLLKSVGAAPALLALEKRHIGGFDRICVPSRRLGEMLPAGGRVEFIPQGVDSGVFDRAVVSPYPEGSRNAVAVGDMLFDRPTVEKLAKAAPEVTFHLFGIDWQGQVPANIRIHGEQSFDRLVPYIRHADIGIAPYRLGRDEVYLAESSLKLLQYGYCLLPVLLPDLIPVSRGNEIPYRPDHETDWRGLVDRALAMTRSEKFREGIYDWPEISRMTLTAAFSGKQG